MKKPGLLLPLLLGTFLGMSAELAAADDLIRIEVVGALPGGGRLHVSLFDCEAAFRKREPCRVSSMNPVSASVLFLFELTEGDYLVSVFQDLDDDGGLDSGFLGLPIEPVGLSRWDGKGVPGGFSRHKLRIDASNSDIQVRLIRVSAGPQGTLEAVR